MSYTSAWDSRFNSRPNSAAAKLAAKTRENCASGTKQTVGRPGGPKAKGHKTPATGILPVIRNSVIPNGNCIPTDLNAAIATDLRKARNKAYRTAKNSVTV